MILAVSFRSGNFKEFSMTYREGVGLWERFVGLKTTPKFFVFEIKSEGQFIALRLDEVQFLEFYSPDEGGQSA